MQINRVVLWILTLTAALPMQAMADDGQLLKMVQGLQEQMMKMQYTIEHQNAKIEALEKRDTPIKIAPPSDGKMIASGSAPPEKTKEVPGWLENLTLKGDLRLRYEAFDFHSGDPAGSDSRNRFRYRLRYGLEKKFNDEIKIGFSFVSGENTNGVQVDPTSTNTTFDNLFNYKDIYVDRAYAAYTPAWAEAGPLKKTTITAGKLDNPFEKGSSDMVWDRDVKPEGIYEKFDFDLFKSDRFDVKSFVALGQFVLDEDIATGEADAELYGEQAGIYGSMTGITEKPVDFLSAFSFYNYSDYAINGNFLIGTTSLARGNTNVAGPATVLDSEDFKVLEYYNEIAFDVRGVPVRPFFDLAHNVASQYVGDEELAWSLGTKIGSIKEKGDWEISYAYRRIEPESIVGAFSDSDFGLGHAGKRGSILKLGYALTDYLTLNGGASFVNNLTTATAGVRDEEQRRFQVDLNWKF